MKNNFGYANTDGIVTIKHRFRYSGTLLRFVIFLAIIIMLPLFFTACKPRAKEIAVTKNPDVYYTCSMHPNVIQEKPGNCPICGMKLIEAKKSQTQKPDEIQLSDGQIQLGNIQVDTIRSGSISDRMVLNATLNFNQRNITALSARIAGRDEIGR